MIIYLVVCRAIDVMIAVQKSMRETQVNRADFIEALPLFVGQFPIKQAYIFLLII
jgi:hypothetical protein